MTETRHSADAPLKVAVLALPPLSIGTLGAIIDPLIEANRLGGRRYYDVRLISLDGAPVSVSNGWKIPVDGALSENFPCSAFVIASDGQTSPVDEQESASLLGALGRLAAAGAAFGATRGGTRWLARARLLDERRVAIHWEDMPIFREQHPALIHCTSLYEVDADRFTASSSLAALDMMLYVVSQQISPQLADAIARALGVERIRPGHEKQNAPGISRVGQHPPKLSEALVVMEANIEEPLSSDEIAACVGISRRQLERLFKQGLGALPSKYYQVLRLERAHQLIVRTQKSIVQIGLSCGFSSGSHFATAYRAHFGTTPREERARSSLLGAALHPAAAQS
jgi:transcriptional regulator GlxA family with amidase domain